MPLHIEDHGAANTVLVHPETQAALHGCIVFTGNGAQVVIGPGCSDAGLRIEAGAGARVSIGRDTHLGNLFIHAAAGSAVRIGSDCGFNGLVRLLLHEPAAITIGDACLLAAEVDVTVSDMHPILDAATGTRLNPARGVQVADHVWIGQRALVLKGATIGTHSVIGAAAVVTGPIPPHCIAAGNPARVIRQGVTWRMEL